MYRRYNHCSPASSYTPTWPPYTSPQCPPLPTYNPRSIPYIPGPSTMAGLYTIQPESVRMVQDQCSTMFLTVQNTISPCQPVGLTRVIQVPVIPGAPLPVATVGTVPASLTTQQQTQALLLVQSDPYNPTTRFAQYFPTPPLPYCPPARLPTNEPPAPLFPCVPTQRFQGSVAE